MNKPPLGRAFSDINEPPNMADAEKLYYYDALRCAQDMIPAEEILHILRSIMVGIAKSGTPDITLEAMEDMLTIVANLLPPEAFDQYQISLNALKSDITNPIKSHPEKSS